ncbi:MAG: HAD family hydrolase [Thermoplasmatota archaeon]
MTAAPEAPEAPPGRPVVVATDLDRTFTREDLALSPEAIQRARRLRQEGVHVILVTGRPSAELRAHELRGCFDAMVLEGGAVWGRPGRWTVPPVPDALWEAAKAAAAQGHGVREGWASFSASASAATFLQGRGLSWRCNRDRIDVTAPGVDKGSGLRAALDELRLRDPWVLGIGDAANDIPLFGAAAASVAVANAEPELAALAGFRAPHPAHRGFLWAVSRLGKRG